MSKEMQLVHSEIRNELTPDQIKKFDALLRARPGMERHRPATNSAAEGGSNSLPVNPVLSNAMPVGPNGEH